VEAVAQLEGVRADERLGEHHLPGGPGTVPGEGEVLADVLAVGDSDLDGCLVGGLRVLGGPSVVLVLLRARRRLVGLVGLGGSCRAFVPRRGLGVVAVRDVRGNLQLTRGEAAENSAEPWRPELSPRL